MVVSAAIAVGAAATYTTYKAGREQKKAQEKQLALQKQQNADAKQRAKEAKEQSDIEMNKANRKKANTSAIQSKAEQAALTGPAGTMLTGNMGVDPNQLNLGKSTLLGG